MVIIYIGGRKVTKEEIEQQWQNSLKEFLSFHRSKVTDMTEEEEKKYVEKNKVNEELVKLQRKFQTMYRNTQR